MVIGISGSRSITAPIPDGILPKTTTKIITGGANGIDRSAREYAHKHHILIEEILPAYDLYGKNAPLIRNDIIIQRSSAVFVFWDGKSRGSAYVIKKCKKLNVFCRVYLWNGKEFTEYEDED